LFFPPKAKTVYLLYLAVKSKRGLKNYNKVDFAKHFPIAPKAAVTRSAQNTLWNNALLFVFHALLCNADTLDNTTKARSDLNT
jgi:hypothetical protein